MSNLARRTLLFLAMAPFASPRPGRAAAMTAALYKAPNCGCCDGYGRYLQENFVSVEVIANNHLTEMRRQVGIPEDLAGCHLTMLDGYVVDGHVPYDSIRKLLTERPTLAAITLPGMPSGSPGMSGTATTKLAVYAIPRNGAPAYIFSA